MTEVKLIDMEGVGPVLLERSVRAKKLGITVRPFARVRVAVPRGVSFATAELAAYAKKEWLRRNVAKIRKVEENSRAFREEARSIDPAGAGKILADKVARLAARYGFTYNRLTIRNQKTRWGSCSAKNNISLNIRLVLLPELLCDYIILHELVHTRVKNHGPHFWDELLRVEPRARELDRELGKLAI